MEPGEDRSRIGQDRNHYIFGPAPAPPVAPTGLEATASGPEWTVAGTVLGMWPGDGVRLPVAARRYERTAWWAGGQPRGGPGGHGIPEHRRE